MKPTTIGSPPPDRTTPGFQAIIQAGPIQTGAIVLRSEQLPEAEKALASLDFAAMQSGDVIKIGLLESRALALEGTYTRLPADQMVFQQIEQAGITTLQETATTVASIFASNKMTLL